MGGYSLKPLFILAVFIFLLSSCRQYYLPFPGFDDGEEILPWNGDIDTSWYTDSEDSFVLSQPEQLAGLAELLNSGESFANKTVYLANDVDLGNRIWTPIGTAWEENGEPAVAFQGTFDGQNHSISNFSVSVTETGMNGNSNAGFFGGVGGDSASGVVRDINFRNAHVEASGHHVGIAVGVLHYGTVSGITTDEASSVKGGWYKEESSGLLSALRFANTTISECINNAEIVSGQQSGGVVGYSLGSNVLNCANNGDITTESANGIGGIVGHAAGENGLLKDSDNIITGCINNGTVKAASSGIAGGIVGRVGGAGGGGTPETTLTISSSHNNGSVFAGDVDMTASSGIVGSISHFSGGNTGITVTVDGQLFAK